MSRRQHRGATLSLSKGGTLGTVLRRGEWELAALALLLAAAQALDSLPPQAASGLVEALSDGESWAKERSRPRPRTGPPHPKTSTPGS